MSESETQENYNEDFWNDMLPDLREALGIDKARELFMESVERFIRNIPWGDMPDDQHTLVAGNIRSYAANDAFPRLIKGFGECSRVNAELAKLREARLKDADTIEAMGRNIDRLQEERDALQQRVVELEGAKRYEQVLVNAALVANITLNYDPQITLARLIEWESMVRCDPRVSDAPEAQKFALLTKERDALQAEVDRLGLICDDEAVKHEPCRFCDEPHETICENCAKPVCYGCAGHDDYCPDCDDISEPG